MIARTMAALVILAAIVATASMAETPVVTSFHGNGDLTWTNVPNPNAFYRVEWASTLADDLWRPLLGAGGPMCLDFEGHTNASFSVPVPMFYRVVMITNTPPAGMVLIPKGSNSGSNPLTTGESHNTNYPSEYLLSADWLWMDKWEISKAQWHTVYEWALTNGYAFDHAGFGKANDHPVHTVNWYDCAKWCNARSQMEGRTPAYYTSTTHTMATIYKTGQVEGKRHTGHRAELARKFT